MSIAYWCVLVAAVLPYVWYGAARAGAGRIDNRDPRSGMARLDEGSARRANHAQYNAFEAFAPFAAAVLMAQAAGVDPQRITQLALAFVALRVLHGLFYIGNLHALRSTAWAGGFAVVVWLMVQAALKLGG
jgi:uncharacterized MAPEG superfamily protein